MPSWLSSTSWCFALRSCVSCAHFRLCRLDVVFDTFSLLEFDYIRFEIDKKRVYFIKSWHLVTADNADFKTALWLELRALHYVWHITYFAYIKFRCLAEPSQSHRIRRATINPIITFAILFPCDCVASNFKLFQLDLSFWKWWCFEARVFCYSNYLSPRNTFVSNSNGHRFLSCKYFAQVMKMLTVNIWWASIETWLCILVEM